jgi:hypothetical protein
MPTPGLHSFPYKMSPPCATTQILTTVERWGLAAASQEALRHQICHRQTFASGSALNPEVSRTPFAATSAVSATNSTTGARAAAAATSAAAAAAALPAVTAAARAATIAAASAASAAAGDATCFPAINSPLFTAVEGNGLSFSKGPAGWATSGLSVAPRGGSRPAGCALLAAHDAGCLLLGREQVRSLRVWREEGRGMANWSTMP